MKYLIHRRRYIEYLQAQEDLNRVLDEWVLAFQKTQPKSQTYGDKVQSSVTGSMLDEYVIAVEDKRLYARIKSAREIMYGKGELLQIEEDELRKSKNIYDLIYTYKWVDGLKPKEIYRKLDMLGMTYSESQIYEIRKRIKHQIERSEQ